MKLTIKQQEILDDLIGQAEITEITGASRGLVSNWLKRPATGFPEPIVVLRAGPFFSRREVEAWWDNYQSKRR